jgi:hypothetical protein
VSTRRRRRARSRKARRAQRRRDALALSAEVTAITLAVTGWQRPAVLGWTTAILLSVIVLTGLAVVALRHGFRGGLVISGGPPAPPAARSGSGPRPGPPAPRPPRTPRGPAGNGPGGRVTGTEDWPTDPDALRAFLAHRAGQLRTKTIPPPEEDP